MHCAMCGRLYDKSSYGDICSGQCFNNWFWFNIYEQQDAHIIANGVCYRAGPEDAIIRGYDGALFKFKKGDEIIETTNLWTQGTIPENWRKLIKDNAVRI